MPNLSELGLDEGAAPQVDWNAPEAGQAPPPVYPGIYTLLFKMPDDVRDWFDVQESELVKGKPETRRKFLILKATPIVTHIHTDSEGQPSRAAEGRPVQTAEGEPIRLGPQRISFYKSDKMLISRGGELLRALGIRLDGPIVGQIEDALKAVNGRVNFLAEIGWRTYFKSTDTTVSTMPNKKKGEIPWPRLADGKPELLATNPNSGEHMYGYAEIIKIFAPQASS